MDKEVKEFERQLYNRKVRAIELENGIQFGVLNSTTEEFEHFEYQDGKLLELKEYKFTEYGNTFIVYRPTGLALELEYINHITK